MVNIADIKTGRPSESGGHWYARDGSCCYEIRSKSTGELRPVTLRDAKKYGLVPGYSSIEKMEHKPQLERWKLNQMLDAAITLPRRHGETDEQFKARAEDDAWVQVREAAARGTHLHAALQGFYEGQPVDAADAPFVWPVVTWISKRFPGASWLPEQSFAHPLGYGGKADLISRDIPCVLDFKFKDFDESDLQRPNFKLGYDNHELQLHAYEHGFGFTDSKKVNLFISSTVPKLIVPVEWETNQNSLEVFKCLLRLWQLRKNYNSSFTRDVCAA